MFKIKDDLIVSPEDKKQILKLDRHTGLFNAQDRAVINSLYSKYVFRKVNGPNKQELFAIDMKAKDLTGQKPNQLQAKLNVLHWLANMPQTMEDAYAAGVFMTYMVEHREAQRILYGKSYEYVREA